MIKGGIMDYSNIKEDFRVAAHTAKEDAIKKLAEGLEKLTGAIDHDMRELKREIDAVKSRVK